MANSGYTGISFPFRVGNSGGVVLSTTNRYSAEHIVESVIQILNTKYTERPMEAEIFSDIDASLFDLNNQMTRDILADQIVADLRRLEKRISLNTRDIELFTVETDDGIEQLYANINFRVVDYMTTYQAANVYIGEVS